MIGLSVVQWINVGRRIRTAAPCAIPGFHDAERRQDDLRSHSWRRQNDLAVLFRGRRLPDSNRVYVDVFQTYRALCPSKNREKDG